MTKHNQFFSDKGTFTPPRLEVLKTLKDDELNQLATVLRQEIINVVSQNGGHLASNLGVIELTIALLKAYDLPSDKIVFDVGHQTYAWKLLTGRAKQFSSLRQKDGLSGFPKTSESAYDAFNTGHSSTSVSAALGLARASRLRQSNTKVAAVIGDGAMTGGMAFEALNELGMSDEDVLVVLNDNQMSISANVGGLSTHLGKLRVASWYLALKERWDKRLDRMPGGKTWRRIINRIKRWLRQISERQSSFFEAFGLKYYGPIDGHDVATLTHYLTNLRHIKGPKLLHVVTTKGKGYTHAENSPDKYHGVAPFKVEQGVVAKTTGNLTFSTLFGHELAKLAEIDERVYAITAAMTSGTGLSQFATKYPTKFADVGIAEQHALTMAAGLAMGGMRPYVAIYSTFLQRAYDQLVHDIALQDLPVIVCVDRAGIVGEDGETHQGIYDLSFLRTVPNIEVYSPFVEADMVELMNYSLTANHPCVIRYPRDVVKKWPEDALARPQAQFKGLRTMSYGDKVIVIALGVLAQEAYAALTLLGELAKNVAICSLICSSAGVERDIIKTIASFQAVVVLEDGVSQGGIGEAIGSAIQTSTLKDTVLYQHYAIANPLADQASRTERLIEENLDAQGIATHIRSILLQLN